MTAIVAFSKSLPSSPARFFGVMASLLFMATLTGCGSTKVVTADKTIIYKDALYNVSNVQRMRPRIEASLPDSSRVDLKQLDRKGKQRLFNDHSQLRVTMAIELDQEDLVYLNTIVKNYSEYSRLEKRFESAQKDIGAFMASSKKTQLKLR